MPSALLDRGRSLMVLKAENKQALADEKVLSSTDVTFYVYFGHGLAFRKAYLKICLIHITTLHRPFTTDSSQRYP